MKPSSASAFTLTEVITAIVICVILTALVIQIFPHWTTNFGSNRTQAEISMLSTACESYKADFGSYPEDLSAEQSTNTLKPRKHFKPTNGEYQLASRFLYQELTGDKVGAGGGPDGIPDNNGRRYLREFDPKLLKTTRDANHKILEVQYIQDPFGYPYAYSTAGAHGERKYLEDLKVNANTPPPSVLDGFNSSSFDMWSTGGSNPAIDPTDNKTKEREWAKWIRNW